MALINAGGPSNGESPGRRAPRGGLPFATDEAEVAAGIGRDLYSLWLSRIPLFFFTRIVGSWTVYELLCEHLDLTSTSSAKLTVVAEDLVHDEQLTAVHALAARV